jgi:hypothetical protein
MTTHETQPETFVEPTSAPAQPAPAEPALTEPAPAEPASAETEASATSLEDDEMLFAEGELSGLRARWTEVQAAFVDDPRDCVQKADGLVADVVDKVTSGFSGARSHLEEQWDRGEEVSTEDLRIALKRYREFFERLLAV